MCIALTCCLCVVLLLQDLAATAIAGGELPDEQSPEEMAGDYSWDCEYNFDLLVGSLAAAMLCITLLLDGTG